MLLSYAISIEIMESCWREIGYEIRTLPCLSLRVNSWGEGGGRRKGLFVFLVSLDHFSFREKETAQRGTFRDCRIIEKALP